jgi:hypothetical protein
MVKSMLGGLHMKIVRMFFCYVLIMTCASAIAAEEKKNQRKPSSTIQLSNEESRSLFFGLYAICRGLDESGSSSGGCGSKASGDEVFVYANAANGGVDCTMTVNVKTQAKSYACSVDSWTKTNSR